ncbi:ribosome maturation factor RimM [Dactylosporangium matsuzakiense]|uniref:ribosome maturation factor RimM n=1 Tax=Dactylosporangium matsuzakiense TaxID=53360 RepID=UPI0021C284D3|nr:ribosome maturation factor RimM [Dactylosporangium matsuzakiense]UWZ49422.1 ribosome maturation factor RimM [Dactylosporangium matsuzakiense]
MLVVGQIFRAHGVRGEVVVDVRTDAPAERFAVGLVLVTDSTAVRHLQTVPAGAWRPPATLTIESVRPHQGRLLVVFEGIYDRNLAEDMRGVLLCVDSDTIPASDDPDEFNDHELVGLDVVDAAGERLGELLRVDHAPAHDLLVVKLTDGRTGLVPFVREIVPEVDVPGRRIVVTPPEGLFDL